MGIDGIAERGFRESLIKNAGNNKSTGNVRNTGNIGNMGKPTGFDGNFASKMAEYMALSASGGVHASAKSQAAYETYESANYKIVPDNEAGCFTIYNRQGERIGAFDYADIKIRQDAATGRQFLISEHGTMCYDATVFDEELQDALKNVMDIGELKTEALRGFTLKTHAGTGIQYLIRDGEEGRGGKVLLQNEEDVRKYEALAETYFHKYSKLIKDKNAAYIYADLEIKGLAQHTERGILSMGYDGISYHDNLESKKNWSVLFSGDAYQRMFAWLQGNQGSRADIEKISTWLAVL